MACVLQWCCALFFVLITMFSSSECRRSGGGRRVSIRTYTYSKPKPSYRLPSGVSTAKRYPGYPIHQGQGGAAAFPGGFGPGPGGFGRFGPYEPTRHGYAGSNTFDSSTHWLSLYSLTRDVNHYHFYYPNSRPAKNIPERGSFSTQDGNMTCISIYNAKAVTKWATDTLNDLKKVFPQTQSSVTGNSTRIGFNFTVVPGEIVHNETLGVVCCGTAKGIVNLAILTSGKDPDVNCMFKQFNMPFRKLKFIPMNSTFGNNTTSTTNATASHPKSNNTTARNFTVAQDSNSTMANTTVASDGNSTTTNITTVSNSNNITTANTTVISNSNSGIATNTIVVSNSINRTPANTTIVSNSNNRTATNTTVILNPPISTKDNSTVNTASSTTAVPINAETHIQNIQMTTKAS